MSGSLLSEGLGHIFGEMFLQRFIFYFSSGYYRDLMIIPLPGFIAINVIVVLVFIP